MHSPTPRLVALFDAAHGQSNWAQTGFPSRDVDGNLRGFARLLAKSGWRSQTHRRGPLSPEFREHSLVVVPPPTGDYDARRELWRPASQARFTPSEILNLHQYVATGGRLLLFAYRFGDVFLGSNLGELTASFGCLLHEDAVVDTRRLSRLYPLLGDFQTGFDSIVAPWARSEIRMLRWRTMATFSILPNTCTFPVVLSPGGACPAYNRRHRSVSFRSQPIVAAGHIGAGRFLFVGGPHTFEDGPTGLLHTADNRRFVENCMHWLTDFTQLSKIPSPAPVAAASGKLWSEFSEVTAHSSTSSALITLERALRNSQTFRALPEWKWKGRAPTSY